MRQGGFIATIPSIAAMSLTVIAPAAFADRPMSTDRPDRTESAYSVPAERFQVELDFVSFGHFANDSSTIDSYAILPFVLKYGFTSNVDVQLLFVPYASLTQTSGGTEYSDDGSGPLGMRFKINLTGNDDGGTALALLPYFLAPTRGIDKLDNTLWGLAVPFAFPLADGRGIGAMVGTEGTSEGGTFGFASVVFSTPVADAWSGFVELYAIADGFDDADAQIATLNAGAVLDPGRNWALDAGVYYGITSDTENWRVFVGASARR